MRTRTLRSFKKFNDRQKDNPWAVRRRKKQTVVNEELVLRRRISKQELRCCRQDRNQNAEVKTGVENIQFVSLRIRWFRRKDER